MAIKEFVGFGDIEESPEWLTSITRKVDKPTTVAQRKRINVVEGKAKACPLEQQEQIRLVAWMVKRNLLFFAVPNGGKRTPAAGKLSKLKGERPGVPDLVIPMPRGGYHGMFVEMKRLRGGQLADNQVFWRDALNKQGYLSIVAYGFAEAQEAIMAYFGMEVP